MVTSEHLSFVSSAYKVLLDRDPEPAGLKHWSECLANGLPKPQFLRAVISSNECQTRLGSPLGDRLDGLTSCCQSATANSVCRPVTYRSFHIW